MTDRRTKLSRSLNNKSRGDC